MTLTLYCIVLEVHRNAHRTNSQTALNRGGQRHTSHAGYSIRCLLKNTVQYSSAAGSALRVWHPFVFQPFPIEPYNCRSLIGSSNPPSTPPVPRHYIITFAFAGFAQALSKFECRPSKLNDQIERMFPNDFLLEFSLSTPSQVRQSNGEIKVVTKGARFRLTQIVVSL